jgi:hypothetical protein
LAWLSNLIQAEVSFPDTERGPVCTPIRYVSRPEMLVERRPIHPAFLYMDEACIKDVLGI